MSATRLHDVAPDLFDAAAADAPTIALSYDEIIIDCFAGGGGASLGIEWATGRSPDEAINHSETALAIHAANHPTTRHHHSDIWEVDPRDVAEGRAVGLLWLSPDCTHFSKAKGGKPVSKKIRALAHVAIRYAATVKPRVIILENVEEFVTWGPVARATGKPDPRRKGQSFRAFVRQLRRHGYVVEWRLLRGCDFGAPTIRKRLFLVARCDGAPIRWPRPTHGPGRALPWHTASECIDWSLPCPSIFLTREEGRALGVRRPLAEATLRRIARGVERYVINAAEPFLVPVTHQGDDRVYGIGEPLRTVTSAHRGEQALVVPSLVEYHAAKRPGDDRVRSVREPLPTQTTENRFGLVTAFLAKHFGGVVGASLSEPMPTVTATDHNALVSAAIVEPGQRHGRGDRRADAPLSTIVGKDRHALVAAFLSTYYSAPEDAGQSVRDPMRTVTAKDRRALVTVHGSEYIIADIGMRMLTPRELATAQGFPLDYRLAIPLHGRVIPKSAQTEMVGNSVNPHVACALVVANFGARVAREGAA